MPAGKRILKMRMEGYLKNMLRIALGDDERKLLNEASVACILVVL